MPTVRFCSSVPASTWTLPIAEAARTTAVNPPRTTPRVPAGPPPSRAVRPRDEGARRDPQDHAVVAEGSAAEPLREPARPPAPGRPPLGLLVARVHPRVDDDVVVANRRPPFEH